MSGRVGRKMRLSRNERLCQIVDTVLILERGQESPTVSKIAKKLGLSVSSRLRDMVNDLVAVGMFVKIETLHWNKAPRMVYKINPSYTEIPDLKAFADVCAGFGYQIPLSGFDSPISHDKVAKP